jgi:DNA-binding beta-propeller fold protein YncE
MRAANGKLLVAENGSGRISVIAVDGDKATVTVIKEGLNTPTAVEPAGDVIWIAERGAGKAVSIPMPR